MGAPENDEKRGHELHDGWPFQFEKQLVCQKRFSSLGDLEAFSERFVPSLFYRSHVIYAHQASAKRQRQRR